MEKSEIKELRKKERQKKSDQLNKEFKGFSKFERFVYNFDNILLGFLKLLALATFFCVLICIF
jgi:hypothetical protein